MAILAWAGNAISRDDNIRQILVDVLSTEYCGTAISDGLGIDTAMNGQSPVPGHGFVKLTEEEWGPVLLEMARAEVDQYITASQKRPSSTASQQNTANADTVRLSRMMALMQTMTHHQEESLEIIERIALECPQTGGLVKNAMLAWMRSTLPNGQVERCLQLASEFRRQRGENSDTEWEFCCLLLHPGLEWCDSQKSKASVSEWLLEKVEQCEDYARCRRFEGEAAAHMEGWIGSLQRKRLAERFKDEPARGSFVEWNAQTGKWERTPPTASDIADMLSSRASAELVADESSLTDLKKTYKAETQEGDR